MQPRCCKFQHESTGQIALLLQTVNTMVDESVPLCAEAKKEMSEIKADIAATKQQSAKWKGGIAVLAGVGGFFLIALTVFKKLANAFKG